MVGVQGLLDAVDIQYPGVHVCVWRSHNFFSHFPLPI